MKAIAFNGSPRKRHNTGQLLEKALDGAASLGWETEMVQLYDLMYNGCISCFACKTVDGGSYGQCAMCDDLTPVLERAGQADILFLGTPVYLGNESGQMRSFLERLVFPYLTYTKDLESLFTRPVRTALIYTSGIGEAHYATFGLDRQIALTHSYMERIFGHNEIICYGETRQFDNPDAVYAPAKDFSYLENRHQTEFPKALDNAFALGKRLAGEMKA